MFKTQGARLFGSATLVALAVGQLVAPGPVAAHPTIESSASPVTRHVVLIDWDGFDPSYLGRVPTPALDALRARGSQSFAASTYRAISNPARASLATGAYPATHHNAAYVFNEAANTVLGQNRTIDAENIATSITRQGGTVASVGWYIVENKGTYQGNPAALYVPGGSCVDNGGNAVRVITGQPVWSGGSPVTVPGMPSLLAVYCSELDSIGHRGGPNSPEIAPTLAMMDAQLGRIVDATKAAGVYDETTFVVVSDHGMTAFSRTVHDELLATLAEAGFRAEIIARGQYPRPDTEVVIAENERAGAVYLRGSATSAEARSALRRVFASLPQIARVQDQVTLDLLRVAPAEGDFVLEARAPWCFVRPGAMPPAGAEKGAHSTLDEIMVPLFIAGGGVRPDRPPVLPRTVDLAPTISALLGLTPPAQTEGRVLGEILTGTPA